MKIIIKNQFPLQICKTCKSIISVSYKDLKWEDDFLRNRKNRWKCPLCKENNNVIAVEKIDLNKMNRFVTKITKQK